jgi:excisionase family DNA binding protein
VSHYSQTEERTDNLMGVEELAKFLAVGRTYAYRLLAEGEIPCARIGRLRRVRRSDAEKFVEARMECGGPDAA